MGQRHFPCLDAVFEFGPLLALPVQTDRPAAESARMDLRIVVGFALPALPKLGHSKPLERRMSLQPRPVNTVMPKFEYPVTTTSGQPSPLTSATSKA